MNAHPAGPRHAQIPHAPNLPERPADTAALNALATKQEILP